MKPTRQTIEEAVAIAIAVAIDDQTEPRAHPQRQRFDKLQRTTAAEDLSAGVTEMAKSFGTLGHAINQMQKRIDHLAAELEYLQTTFTPNAPLRKYQS